MVDEDVFLQTSFLGLNTGLSASKIPEGMFAFLQNARVRTGAPVPVKKCVKVYTGVPPEFIFQGFYGIGQYVILFASGRAYVKDLTIPEGGYTQLQGFLLSDKAEVIYAESVPASTTNFARELGSNPSANKGINLTSSISGTISCIICQDGSNQPLLIFPDGEIRKAQSYAQWTLDKREYVPIMKMMKFVDGVLYGIAPDGINILRSVSGRPLDFVINIDTDGNKGGDAYTTAHSVDSNQITAIDRAYGNQNAKLIVSSLKATTMLVAKTTDTLFGEPLFSNVPVMPTGAVNHRSIFVGKSDTVVIDEKGVRSFNATQQLLIESNNDVFSGAVFNLFNETPQDITCIGSYDNYILFACNTIYGYGVLVYDISTSFVSFDQYEGIGAITYMVEAKVNGKYRLFFTTIDNQLYEAYADSAQSETAFLFARELSVDNPMTQLNLAHAVASITNIKTSGMIQAGVLVDRSYKSLGSYKVDKNSFATNDSLLPYPKNTSVENPALPLTWNGKGTRSGQTVGVAFSWNFDGMLLSCGAKCDRIYATVSPQQKALINSR